MIKVLSGVWALLPGIVLIVLGNGMHFTLIGLRGGIEGLRFSIATTLPLQFEDTAPQAHVECRARVVFKSVQIYKCCCGTAGWRGGSIRSATNFPGDTPSQHDRIECKWTIQ